MRVLFFISFFFFFHLYSEDLALLSSDTAVFDENTLNLSGNVILRHDLLLMQAQKANLFDYHKDSSPPFSTVHLEQGVSLDFRNNTHLSCDAAFIDFQRLKGALESFQDLAIYTDLLGQQKIPIEIKGRQATFELLKGNDLYFSSCDLKNLSLTEDIFVNYGDQIYLQADKAIFQKFGEYETFSLRYIEAFPKSTTSGLCRLLYQEDTIDASSIYIDLNTLSTTMQHPRGILHSAYLPHKKMVPCTFKAESLYWERNWENNTSLISLNIDASIEDPLLGSLSSEEKITLHLVKDFDHFVIHSIHSYGPSDLEYLDPFSLDHQSLHCYGHLVFDRDSLSLKSYLPKTAFGLEEQNHYQNSAFSIYSDFSSIDYQFIDLQIRPHEILFKGNVRMISKAKQHSLRYGVADEILYYPETKETLLLANKGHKVLFWNEEANLKISADKILISIDPLTHQEKIKGLGKVLFAFNQEEEDNFHLLFPLYRNHLKKNP